MKNKLKAIAGELKKASAKHKGQAEKIEKLIKPKLSKLNKANRKKKAIKRKKKMIDNAFTEITTGQRTGKKAVRALKDIARKKRAIKRKESKI